MAEQLILEFQGFGKAGYERVNQTLGIDMSAGSGDWPEGLRQHIGSETDDGNLVVVEIWDSREQQQQFLESRLGPALHQNGIEGGPSRVTWSTTIANHKL